MASNDVVNALMGAVDEVLSLDTQELRHRQEWGKFDFEDADRDLKRIFTVAGHLKALPLAFLPEDVARNLASQVSAAIAPLKQIDGFDIESANPKQQRDQFVQTVTQAADVLYKQVTPWIPFLAYQKGDVAENITQLTKAVTDGRSLVEQAKTDIEARGVEMSDIIEKAREASASAGAAVFTEKFAGESKKQDKSAKSWLTATMTMGVVSVIATIAVVWVNETSSSNSLLLASPKFFLLALLLTATLWCGRMYRAFMHQSTVNQHRALALQTFQAFSAAASDELTKNAVLMEATRSVFGPSASGFLDSKGTPNDAGTRVVEVIKAVGADS